jgi:hypothetical protein
LNEQYDSEMDANSKRELQYGLSCSKESWLIIKYLSSQLNETKVRRQDTISGLRFAAINSYAHMLTWSFVKANWHRLLDRYGNSFSLTYIIADIANLFKTHEQYQEVSPIKIILTFHSSTRNIFVFYILYILFSLLIVQ